MTNKVFFADAVDEGMATASQMARQSFRYFWREQYWEYRRIVPALDLAFVKASFADGDIIEHMWVGEIDFDGYVITGKLANDPHELTNFQSGDIVRIELGDRFTDWMMIKMGELFGAFTIQEMRKNMESEERNAHDEAWGIDFGDPNSPKIPLYSEDQDEDHPMAVNMGDSLVEFLKEHPSENSACGEDGRTTLHNEAIAGNMPVVKILVQHGANKNAKTQRGDTPADLAKQVGWTRIEKFLT